jgi:hypothetical protein
MPDGEILFIGTASLFPYLIGLKALHQDDLTIIDNLGVGVAAVSALLKWGEIVLNLFLL